MATAGDTSFCAPAPTPSRRGPLRCCGTSWPSGFSASPGVAEGAPIRAPSARIPVVIPAPEAARDQRLIWSFWLAAGIVLVGGLLPVVFGGTSSRIAGVILPFAVAAAGFAACALLNTQSRMVVSIIYFLAGLAIVYGLMSIFSLPVRLAALGSCPVAPQPCTTGLPRSLSDAENTGIGSAAAFGIAALFVGFFGLVTVYRRTALPQFAP